MHQPITSHTEEIFNDGDNYFETLMGDIKAASKSIEIEIYLFKFDNIGKQIIEQLIQAAQRGVRVRILVDGIGSLHWSGVVVDKLDAAGITSKIFHPLPWSLGQFKRAVSQRPWLSNLAHFIININTRTHRKIIIIDNQITHIGSRNIDQRHLSLKAGGLNWRDTNIRLINAPIKNLKQSFEHAWSFQNKILKKIQQRLTENIDTNSLIRLNDSRYKRRVLYKHLLKKIAKANNKIWITNAYFIPNHFFLKKITDAAKKGVDVRILLPQTSDITVMTWASEIFYNDLHKAGIRIFEYKPCMLHAKTIIIDDWVMIGTSNLNHRSLLHDLEVDVILKKLASCRQMIDQFQKDLQSSEEITNPNQQKRSCLKRIIGKTIMLLKFIM